MTNLTLDHLTALLDFQHNATPATFRAVFGNLGDHLWEKFERRNGDLLRFFSLIDDRNAQLLVDHLNQRAQADQGVL